MYTELSFIPIETVPYPFDQSKIEFSCGFLAIRKNHLFIITSAHAIKEGYKVRLVYDDISNTFPFPNFYYFNPSFIEVFQATNIAKILSKINENLQTQIKVKDDQLLFHPKYYMDLAVCEIPTNIKAFDNLEGSPNYGKEKLTIPIVSILEPSQDETYSFSGIALNKDATKKSINHLVFDLITINDLKFSHIEENYIYFKTNNQNNIMGCSGAPIFDHNGNLISMVIKREGNYIKGNYLRTLPVILDTESGEIKK